MQLKTLASIRLHLLAQKLDPITHNDYSESLDDPRELQKIQDFLNFLEGKFVSWESSRRKPDTPKTSYQPEPVHNNRKFHNSYKAFSTHHQNVNNYSKSKAYANDNEDSTKCPHCNQEHKLFSCKTFLELQPDAKRKAVAKYNLCKNCLQAHRNDCMSRRRCRVCNSDHNTLLHDAYGKGNGQTSNHRPTHQNTVNDNKNKMPGNSSNHVYQEDLSETLLTTALINVKAYDGKLIVLRALLDQGSQTSLITERAAQLLKLPRSRCKGVIFGIGATENNCKGVITITCSSINNDYTFDTDVFIMRNLQYDTRYASTSMGVTYHSTTQNTEKQGQARLPIEKTSVKATWNQIPFDNNVDCVVFLHNNGISQEQSTVPYSLTEINKALYFDKMSNMQFIRDEWKLIVYYDMDPYWEGSTTFKKYLEQINNVCEKASNKAICDIILLQLNHSYDELQYYDTMLLSQHFKESMRKRRGLIDGVGYVANSLFGVLDQRFADKYEKDISLIKENEKTLARLWKNQTSVVEAEYNLLKRTESAINRQHKVIHQHLNNLTQATNTLSKNVQEQEVMNELALSTIIATNMLSKLKSIQDTLIESITDIHHGMFSAHVLSPGQLRDQLSIISGQLSRELSLPIENTQTELSKVFPLLRVKARMTKQYLIFEIRIPLVNRERYDLYQLIPIPGQQGNTTVTVIPVSDYIAIDLRKDTYLAMTKQDIQQCIQNGEYTRLCHSRKPVYQFKSEDSLCIKSKNTDKCLTAVAACRNSWIELNKINTYLFYCCGQCTIRIICERQFTATQITKAGVITLDSDCVIKGQDFTVFSHKMQHSEVKTAAESMPEVIAPINQIINVSVPQVNLTYVDQQDALQHIKEQIDHMKSESVLIPDMSNHDIHQYSIIYILLLGAVFSALAFIFRWYCRRRQGSTNLQSDFERPQPVPIVSTHRPDNASCAPVSRPRREPSPSHSQEAVELSNF
ncbi:hypothetical protein SFRURICE_009253 [Spodoptera frugiperda]|nr:hypothetical protein SFRURICE_009253 [Spodoptera frugiperda]